MKLNNRVYDVMKWIVMIALPALAVFITAIGETWGIQNVEAIVSTINAITVLMGSLIGVSTYTRNKEHDQEDAKDDF